MKQNPKYRLYFGGWYQRTTLHLTEIYDFFAKGHSKLPLNKEKLESLRSAINFTSTTRETGYLEYIYCKTDDGISLRYYEDGLYLLMKRTNNPKEDTKELKQFYEEKLMPAVNYLFSLGAPTPKILANIQQEHPTVIVGKRFEDGDLKDVYSEITSDFVTVYKTPEHLLFKYKLRKDDRIQSLIETQIFFREFKDQLEKYLNIHRTIWEKVSRLKESSIRGMDVVKKRLQMESYQRTVSLINNRINQMASYIRTRQSIAKESGVEEHMTKIFDYKFDTLANTHSYIKEIWAMTEDYISSILGSLSEIEGQKLNNSVKTLQLLSSIGVISGAIGYFTRTDFPQFTSAGVTYFLILVIGSTILNYIISWVYRHIKYKLKNIDTSKL